MPALVSPTSRLEVPFITYNVKSMRVVIIFVGSIFVEWSLSGCTVHRSHKIAVIPETTGTELWESLHAGVEQSVAGSEYKAYWNAPTREDDIEGQITLIEAAILRKDAGLIVAPDHSLALFTPLHEAQDSGIPVAIVRSSLPLHPGPRLALFVNDDYAMGEMAARYAAGLLHGRGNVAVVGLNPNLTGVMSRFRAFETEIKDHYPHIQVVERISDAPSSAEAEQLSVELLSSHANLSAIVALTTTSSEGTWAAVTAQDRRNTVKLIGCDQELDLMSAIRHDEIDGVLVENTNKMGMLAADWIVKHSLQSTPGVEIHVQPILVTKANIDDPNIQLILSANWRPHKQ